MRCRILGLALMLSTTVLAHGVVAQEITPTLRPADDIITPGQILLRRTEVALSPKTEAEWEETFKRRLSEAEQSMQTASQEQLNKMRDENARLQQQLTAQQMLVANAATAQQEALQAKLAAAQTQIAAQQQAIDTRMAALDETTTVRLNAHDQVANQKFAALAQIADTESKLTEARLATISAETRAQIAALGNDVEHKLNYYATQQLARVEHDTQVAMADIAKNARLDVLELQKQTAAKLAEIRDQANQKAADMAAARAAEVEQKLAAAVESKTSADDVKQLAREQLADAAPEMRALALQTLSDSQDYIKTVARDAVKDDDPEVQEALQNAAKNVITKDNQVVFAIRQAMAKQAMEENGATVTAAMQGSEHDPAIDQLGGDINLNTDNLTVKAPQGDKANVAQVVASLGGQKTSLLPARNRRDWVDLRKYHVVVHEDGKTLEELLGTVLARAEPFTGPWKIKWKISPENKDILTAKFSLDTETSFEEFVSYLAQYLVNDRGVKITFSLFDRDRIIVISD